MLVPRLKPGVYLTTDEKAGLVMVTAMMTMTMVVVMMTDLHNNLSFCRRVDASQTQEQNQTHQAAS